MVGRVGDRESERDKVSNGEFLAVREESDVYIWRRPASWACAELKDITNSPAMKHTPQRRSGALRVIQ